MTKEVRDVMFVMHVSTTVVTKEVGEVMFVVHVSTMVVRKHRDERCSGRSCS